MNESREEKNRFFLFSAYHKSGLEFSIAVSVLVAWNSSQDLLFCRVYIIYPHLIIGIPATFSCRYASERFSDFYYHQQVLYFKVLFMEGCFGTRLLAMTNDEICISRSFGKFENNFLCRCAATAAFTLLLNFACNVLVDVTFYYAIIITGSPWWFLVISLNILEIRGNCV